MKKIILPRWAGKTTKLIELSEATWKYIVALDKQRVDHIWKMAKDLKKDIHFPITLHELKYIYSGSILQDSVLVDDMDSIIEYLISKAFWRIQIDEATFTKSYQIKPLEWAKVMIDYPWYKWPKDAYYWKARWYLITTNKKGWKIEWVKAPEWEWYIYTGTEDKAKAICEKHYENKVKLNLI